MTKVVKKEAQLPAEMLEELKAAGQQYQEVMDRDDMSIPFLQILQSLSPQCTKGDPDYIKGAEPSDLFETVSRRLFKTRDDNDNEIIGARILPIFYKRSFIEWVPRTAGGGFVREWSVEEGLQIITQRNDQNLDIIQEGSPLGTPGNQLNDTHTHFAFLLNEDGTYEPVVLTMASTQIKPSKDLNSMVAKHALPDGTRMPRFFGIYGITTQRRSNDQGSWYVWKFVRESDVVKEDRMDLFRAAKEFYDGIKAGEHKADFEKAAPSVNPEAKVGDEEVPF